MIQKATWIIPGILVTLLLGLLWAMPAFAARANDPRSSNSNEQLTIGGAFVSMHSGSRSTYWYCSCEDPAPTADDPGEPPVA